MTVKYQERMKEIDVALRVKPDQHLDFRANESIIERILKLRDEKDVLILGHNYMEPLVYQLSGRKERGDSLALARYAAKCDNPIILFDGVKFMAETAKILNPEKKVLIASLKAGCSLADPFEAKDVLEYKDSFYGLPVVTYVNSNADVKAESDYCCTSANALEVIKHAAEEFGIDRVIFFPDTLMGQNLQDELKLEGSDLEVIFPGKYDNKIGKCEVHEKFTVEMIAAIRKQYDIPKNGKDAAVIVHWECSPEVLREADFYGSTSQMGKYIRDHPELKKVWLGTECEMSANLASEFPEVEFTKSCSVACQHMRRITLDGILNSLENEVYEITVPEDLRKRALVPIERMLEIGK